MQGENHLLVGRFMTDIKGPKIVKNRFSKSNKYSKSKSLWIFIKF